MRVASIIVFFIAGTFLFVTGALEIMHGASFSELLGSLAGVYLAIGACVLLQGIYLQLCNLGEEDDQIDRMGREMFLFNPFCGAFFGGFWLLNGVFYVITVLLVGEWIVTAREERTPSRRY